MSVPVWARDKRPSPEGRPLTVFGTRGRSGAPESEGRSPQTGSRPSSEGATTEVAGVIDPGGVGRTRSTKRAESSARLEIARLLAAGVPADEIVAEIHSGQEGEDPLIACNPSVPCPASRGRSQTPSIKEDALPDPREPPRSPGDEPRRKSARAERDATEVPKEPAVKGVPSWAARSATQSLSFWKEGGGENRVQSRIG